MLQHDTNEREIVSLPNVRIGIDFQGYVELCFRKSTENPSQTVAVYV